MLNNIKVDGTADDWKNSPWLRYDATNDVKALDSSKSFNQGVPANDLSGFDFAMDENFLACYLKVKAMPESGSDYHYRVNLMTLDTKQIIYAVIWTSSGNFVQEWDGQGNFLRNVELSEYADVSEYTAAFASNQVFEAKLPTQLFPNLPPQFIVEGVVYNDSQNANDFKDAPEIESSLEWKYNSSSLEVLFKYAEDMEIEPNNPFPLAQAITEGYLYKIADSSTKPLVIADGLAMIEEAEASMKYVFPNQESLAKLPLNTILHWSNRVIMHGGYNWMDYFYLTGGKLNTEAYAFISINASHLKKSREMLDKYKLLDSKDLLKTASNLENWLTKTQRYRRVDPEAMKMLASNSPDSFKITYQDYLKELSNNDLFITTVNSVPIHKGNNFSASFAIDYVYENEAYFGNCVDVAAAALVFYKAIGIPAVHICYGTLFDDEYREIHSFAAHYESSNKRWQNHEHGGNMIYDWAKKGNKPYQVFFYYDMPQIGSYWNMTTASSSTSTSPIVPNIMISTRDQFSAVNEASWLEMNKIGFEDKQP